VLGAWGVGQHADDVTLVATELLQNAVEHTMAGCALRLRLRPDAIVVEVADTDPAPPVPRGHDPYRLDGRGLVIVAAIARHWGWRSGSFDGRSGKVVWAMLLLVPTNE